jgi:argininosuccinate lyase
VSEPNLYARVLPAPVYVDTVLAPLFESVKRYHWRDLMRVHRAHAVMLAGCDLLSSVDAAAILAALEAIETDVAARLQTIQYDALHEDFFFFIDSELRARLGIAVAGRLHTGRSRNDMDQTMLKMKLKERLVALIESVLVLVDAMVIQATHHRDTLVVAYTHGQPAQPTTWGHYLAGMIEVLLRDIGRLLAAVSIVDQCSMGAAAITTTGFPIDRPRMAELLGFACVQENAYGAIAACDYATGAYGALKVMVLNLGRFVQDLGHRTAFEVGHLYVPDAFVQRSSIMPQKRNPVPIEHLRLLCSLSVGHCDAVALAMHNTPFTDMNDNDYTVHQTGYAAIDTAQRVLALLQAFVTAVQVDVAAVRRDIDASSITMTELADSLVRYESIAFAEAHEVCTCLSRVMAKTKGTLAGLSYPLFVGAFSDIVGRAPTMSEERFRSCATPEHFIAVRTRPGGPAPAPMDSSLAGYREQAQSVHAALATHRHRFRSASAMLEVAVRALRTAG